jgi:hypothetical protein
MIRVVRAADKRTWTVRSSISWSKPAMADQFELDLAVGFVSGIVMLGVVVVLMLFLVFWTPSGVVIPAWFVLLILLILLLIPVLWALQRPWVITAYTTEPPSERWEGVVRGMVLAREETRRIADDLKRLGSPEDGNGPLSRVPPSTVPFHDS